MQSLGSVEFVQVAAIDWRFFLRYLPRRVAPINVKYIQKSHLRPSQVLQRGESVVVVECCEVLRSLLLCSHKRTIRPTTFDSNEYSIDAYVAIYRQHAPIELVVSLPLTRQAWIEGVGGDTRSLVLDDCAVCCVAVERHYIHIWHHKVWIEPITL